MSTFQIKTVNKKLNLSVNNQPYETVHRVNLPTVNLNENINKESYVISEIYSSSPSLTIDSVWELLGWILGIFTSLTILSFAVDSKYFPIDILNPDLFGVVEIIIFCWLPLMIISGMAINYIINKFRGINYQRSFEHPSAYWWFFNKIDLLYRAIRAK